MWDALLARDANLYHEAAYAIWRFDARSRVGRITTPTLVVVPERDTVVPVATQNELIDLLDDPEVVRLSDVGHESILARPEEFAAAVHRFLQSPRDHGASEEVTA